MNGKRLLWFPLLLLFALTFAPAAGATEEDVYAILYADKTLVFQYGDAPESGREVTETYPVDLNVNESAYNETFIPWYNKRNAIKAVVFKDAIQPLSMAHWFNGFSLLESIQGLDKVDTSHVVTIARLFAGCAKFTEMDLRGLDTSAVTEMEGVFLGCDRLTSLNLSGWDTSNVTNMGRMFNDCSRLTTLNISGFDTSKVGSMWRMFSGCKLLETLDVSGWNTSNVMDMCFMFDYCSSLKVLDVSDWDTSNVTDMSYMFEGCSALTALDVSRWDTSNVTDMSYMFRECSALTALDVSGFDTSNVTNMSYMFYCCTNLTALDVRGFDTAVAQSMDSMFRACSSLTTLDVSGFDTANVTDMYCMFGGCIAIKEINLLSFDTSRVSNTQYMFYSCVSLVTLDLSAFDLSGVRNVDFMFYNCPNLKTIYVSESFTEPYGYYTFDDCASLVGGAGTKYDRNHKGAEYARIDNPPDEPGYFTKKESSVVRTPVTLTLKLRDSSGKAVSMDDLREGAEIASEVTVADAELKTADIFLVIYDSTGMMIDLQSWEVDLSQPLSFIRTTPIPQDKDASYVKFIMLSSNLTPLTAAQELA